MAYIVAPFQSEAADEGCTNSGDASHEPAGRPHPAHEGTTPHHFEQDRMQASAHISDLRVGASATHILGDEVAREPMGDARIDVASRPGLHLVRLDTTGPHNRRLFTHVEGRLVIPPEWVFTPRTATNAKHEA
jgi:hypothetical protein